MGNKGFKIKSEELDLLKKNTKFSEKELKEWGKIFRKNCNGSSLSCEAFTEIYGKYFPYGNASKFCKRVFAKFDRDASGSIDFSEFITTLNITSNGTIEEKLSWAFSLYDIDSNGFISKIELSEIVTSIYEMIGSVNKNTGARSEKVVDRIFSEMDTDNDGLLSYSEFVDGGKSQAYLANILQVDDKVFQRSLLRRPKE